MNALETLDALELTRNRLAVAEACAGALDFGSLSTAIAEHLFDRLHPDVVALMVPGPEAGTAVVHAVGRYPMRALTEDNLRARATELLIANGVGVRGVEAVDVRTGPQLGVAQEDIRDDAVYPTWSAPLMAGDEVIGVLAIFGFMDWLLAPKTRAGLDEASVLVAQAVRTVQVIEALQARTVRDGLTGVLNRRGFDESIVREVARAERGQRPLSVALVDLDHFKSINDEHGHPEGDRVLREVAAALRDHLRASDIVARFGGDEFAVLLPEVSAPIARRIAERLSTAVSKVTYGAGRRVSISVGVADLAAGEAGVAPEKLVAAADAALYESKRGGRGRVSLAG